MNRLDPQPAADQANAGLPEGFKMTELGPLPEEWQVVRLGEVVNFQGGTQPPKGVHES